MGAEDVAHAGRQMAAAANDMLRAAAQIEETFQRQRVAMDEWLERFEAACKLAAGGGS